MNQCHSPFTGPRTDVHIPAKHITTPNPVENLSGPNNSKGTTDKAPRIAPFDRPRNMQASKLSESIKIIGKYNVSINLHVVEK